MNAVNFIKEKERMCNTCGSCLLCPAWLDDGCIFRVRSSFAPEQQVNTVKVWAEQNPAKTRKSVLLAQYPNARIDSQGIPCICPASVYGDEVCPNKTEDWKTLCYDCRCKFWTQEVE